MKIKNVIWFMAGGTLAGLNFFAGYYYAKKKLEKQYQIDINDAKEKLKAMYEDKKASKESQNKSEELLNKYSSVVTEENNKEEEEDEELQIEPPETIDPVYRAPEVIETEEFEENLDNFEVVTLIYYGGNNLRDELTDEEVDIDETIGRDSLNYTNGMTTFYVRNTMHRTYYEVLIDTTDYLGVANKNRPKTQYDEDD